MQNQSINFNALAAEAGLSAEEQVHFAEGMAQGAENLPLGREAYTILQACVERAVLGQIGADVTPSGHDQRPFAYATPKPLTPLCTPGHPRTIVAGVIFRRNLAISVMDDAALRSTIGGNEAARAVMSVVARRAFNFRADVFSATMDPNMVLPPRMAMHLAQGETVIRVAFVAEQLPSQTAGRLVFGDEASAMYQQIQAMHAENLQAGRGSQYVFGMSEQA